MSSDGGEVGLFTAYTYLLTYLAVFFSNTAKLLNYFSFANVHCLLFCQHCYLVRPGSVALSVSPTGYANDTCGRHCHWIHPVSDRISQHVLEGTPRVKPLRRLKIYVDAIWCWQHMNDAVPSAGTHPESQQIHQFTNCLKWQIPTALCTLFHRRRAFDHSMNIRVSQRWYSVPLHIELPRNATRHSRHLCLGGQHSE